MEHREWKRFANYYQKGLELAEAGRHKEALECIQLYLRQHP